MSSVYVHVLSGNISNIAYVLFPVDSLPLPAFRIKQQKLVENAPDGNRPKIMHSVRSLANSNLQLFTTSAGSWLVLPKEAMQDWPKYVIDRHPEGNLPRSPSIPR